MVEQPETDGGSGSGRPGQMRVRDLLRWCATTHDRGERAEVMVRIADELERAADEIAADPSRAREHREVVAGLRGQADMARVTAAFDGRRARAEHSAAC